MTVPSLRKNPVRDEVEWGLAVGNFGYHLSSTSSAGMVPSTLPRLSQVILTSCSHFIVEEQRLRGEVGQDLG